MIVAGRIIKPESCQQASSCTGLQLRQPAENGVSVCTFLQLEETVNATSDVSLLNKPELRIVSPFTTVIHPASPPAVTIISYIMFNNETSAFRRPTVMS